MWVTIEYELSEDELLEASLHGSGSRIPRWVLGVGSGAVLLQAALLGDLTGIPILAGIFTALTAGPWLQKRMTRSTIRTNRKELCGPTSLSVTERGLRLSGPTFTGETRWAGFVRWQESPSTLLIHPQRNLFYVVPKRAFQAEQLEAFRALLREQIGPPGKVRAR